MNLVRSKKSLAVIIFAITLLFTSCQGGTAKAAAEPLSKTDYLLGTIVEVTLYDKPDEKIIDQVFARIAEIEREMTINNADTSEIIALNNASGKNEVVLSPDTFYVVEKGKQYSENSKGIFDITVGPVVKSWNIGTEYAAIPDKDKLAEAVKLVDYTKLILNKEKHSAYLEVPGMKVDLGAIAKGYAADEAARILKENGVKHAIINLGGNVMTIGGNLKGSPWRIAIQDPFNPRGEFIGVVTVEDKTVVTSGTYERYFEVNGKKYHHILDPFTGYPVENNLFSVSIITDKSIDGDGLSTTCLLYGPEEGMKLIEKLDNVEAVFITADKKVYASSGLKDIFTITNPEFKLEK